MINQNELKRIIERFSLNIFHKGCEQVNYNILNDLPTTPEDIMRKYKISKMPTYRRIKILSNLGLVNHTKNGKIESTELTIKFLALIKELNSLVENTIPQFLEERL